MEVIIVGFPGGLVAQGIWPIWKRGTLAAKPMIARVDLLPVYLIGAVTREEMSGSPVYLYSGYGLGRTADGGIDFGVTKF